MSEHTKEPWRIAHDEGDEYYIEVTSRLSGHTCQLGSGYFSKDDARRIVACVNACAGMKDPEAEIAALRAEVATPVLVATNRLADSLADARAKRDELLAIGLRLIQKIDAGFDILTWDDELDNLRSAIANAEKPPCA